MTAEAVVKETCLHHLVEEQVQRTTQFAAVEFESEFLTYMELNSMANRVATSLIQQGVRAGDVVAMCFDCGVSQIVGVLAVLKAGGVFVPLDLDDPTLRKELMIAECGAKVLLTATSHSRVFHRSLRPW